MKTMLTTGMVSIATLLATGARANTIDFTTPSGASGNDGPLSAEAIITALPGGVMVTLNNFQQNPTSAGQLISGLEFNITDATEGASVAASSGVVSTISAGGGYTAGAPTALPHWNTLLIGSTVVLTTLSGGQPNEMIIGPDDAGSLTGLGNYSNANSSIGNFNPSVLGTAAFIISIPGASASSVISDVGIEFGTGPDTIIGGPPPNVPDGCSTVALLGFAIVVGGLLRRKLGTN
jgi:hypothetical protein